MDIGGEDLVLEGPTSDDDWTVLFRAVAAAWPDVVVERVGPTEVFVYRDQQAFRREPAPDEVPNGFIHVLVHPDCLTVVVDTDPTEARRVGIAAFEAVKATRG